MQCTGCRQPFPDDVEPEGHISYELLGDEVTWLWWHCPSCGAWSEERIRDRFLGPEESSVSGPLDAAVVADWLARLRTCPEPWNKRCRCEVHQGLSR